MKYIIIVFFVLVPYFSLSQFPKEHPTYLNKWRKYKCMPIDSIETIKKDSMIFFFDIKRCDSLDRINKFFKRSNRSLRSMQLLFIKDYSIY